MKLSAISGRRSGWLPGWRSGTERKKGDYLREGAEVALIAYGFTARTSLYAVKRLRKEGQKIGMLRLKTLWPFPDERVAEVGKKVKRIMVPEMNLGQVAGGVKRFGRG